MTGTETILAVVVMVGMLTLIVGLGLSTRRRHRRRHSR